MDVDEKFNLAENAGIDADALSVISARLWTMIPKES